MNDCRSRNEYETASTGNLPVVQALSSPPIEMSSASALRRCFVQFMHPGGEHGPDTVNHKAWNVHYHKRKFLCLQGEAYPTTDVGLPPLRLELAFSGRVGAESETEELSSSMAGGPHWIHRPYYIPPREFRRDGRVFQNTDPFVYGDRFLYILCRQWKKAGGMQASDGTTRSRHGSLIVFGRTGREVVATRFRVGARVTTPGTSGSRP